MINRCRRFWRRAAWPAALLLLSLCLPAPTRAQPERLVLAFYYAWYDEATWTADQVPDMPLAPYRSADRATIERHVREAQSAGIDALVQSWYGPGDNPTESNLATLLDAAQAQGLQVSVDFEVTSPFMPSTEALIAGLRHLIDVHAAHPAFLRYQGRPVVFFWRQGQLSLAQWQAIRSQVDPEHRTIWIAESDNPQWLDVFDGLHLYSITWPVNTNPAYTASKMRKRVDDYLAAHGGARYWVATVMPGYDDTHIADRTQTYIYPRSAEYYRSTWAAAVASAPEMIVINSYNEWREGTMIEPSVTYGRAYLDLTVEWSAAFKSGAAPAAPPPAPTATPMPATPTQAATATSAPTATPTAMPTATATPAPTSTSTPTPTSSPAPTPTPTSTSTPTSTPLPTATPTPTATVTSVPTATATADGLPSDDPSLAAPPCLGAGLLISACAGLAVRGRQRFRKE